MKHVELKLLVQSPYAIDEAYKTVRTNILFSGMDTKVLSITSCDASDGKSTVSFEISKSLCEIGKKVLYIDADMRKSMFAERFTTEKEPVGLSHYLSGQAEFDDVVYITNKENLSVVFSGKFPTNPAELLSGDRFPQLIEKSRELYDFIIIDTPPLGLVSDAMLCVAQSDGAIMVISSERTKSKSAKQVKATIEKTGVRIIGCILNEVHRGTGKYYHYYKYKKYY